MRTFCWVAVFAVTSNAALAQTARVGVPRDTSIRIVRSMPTPEMARQIKLRLDEMLAMNKRREEQLVRDTRDSTVSRDRLDAQTEVLGRSALEVFRLQAQLMDMCMTLRRADEDATPGTLGLHIDKAARFLLERGPQGQTFSMEFEGTPRIETVDAGSPGEKAGVHVGDMWIAMNGRMLMGEVRFDELLTPGANVVLRVNRNGRDLDLPAVAVAKRKSEYPEDACNAANLGDMFSVPLQQMRKIPGTTATIPVPARPGFPNSGMVQMFVMSSAKAQFGGAAVQAIDDDWRANIGVQGDGVGVIEIGAGTPAESAGLHKFDVIRQVNGETVNSPASFMRLVADQRVVVLTVVSKGGAPRSVKLTASPPR